MTCFAKKFTRRGGDTPSGRDSAFHILKQRYLGVSRRALMEWLRAQKALGETRAAVAKPRQSYGERLKRYTFETDLVFLKKTDLVNNNKRFARDDTIPELSYIVSTVECSAVKSTAVDVNSPGSRWCAC